MLNNVEQCTSVATGCHQVATVHIGRSCVGILRSPARNLRSRHLRNGESLILAPLWYGAAPKGQDSTFIRLLCVQDCSGKAVRPYQASCRSKGICEIEGCISCISCIDIVVFVVLMVTHCYVTPCHTISCTASYTKVLSMTWNTPMERRDIFKALHVWHGFEMIWTWKLKQHWAFEHLWTFCALQFLSAFLGLLWHCWFAAERALADWWTSLDCVWLKVKNGRTLKAKTYMIIVEKASESGVFGKSSVETSGSHIVRWHKQGSNNVQQSLGVNEHIPIIIPNCSRIE